VASFRVQFTATEAKFDVLPHVEEGEQGKVLPHHWGFPIPRLDVCHIAPLDPYPPAGRPLEAGNQPQGGGFAATTRADEGNELALLNYQADVLDSFDSIEGLYDVLKYDSMLSHVRSLCRSCSSTRVRCS
jgi:hypothetical protein